MYIEVIVCYIIVVFLRHSVVVECNCVFEHTTYNFSVDQPPSTLLEPQLQRRF